MRMISVLLLVILGAGCGYDSSNKTTPAQPGVVPKINEVVPDSANAGDPGFTLTVNGSSFGTKAVVNWNGTAQPTTYVTAQQIAAAIPGTNLSMPGTVPVTVTNPGTPGSGGPYGGGGTTSETSNVVNFTIH
jgi:hypothetical protein